MSSSSTNSTDTQLQGLRLAVTSTTSLLQKFEHALLHPAKPLPNPSNGQPDAHHEPLALLHTAATLTKAQITKLSLLIINKPFSPTAISTILRDLSTGPLAVMMSAVELCTPDLWGKTMSSEAKSRVAHLLRELRGLMGEIPLDVEAGEGAEGTDRSQPRQPSKDSLASTGVVWEACDALVELKEKGVAGLLVHKAQQYRDTLEDAIAELTEWSQEQDEVSAADYDDQEDDDKDADIRSDAGDGDDDFDTLFNTGNVLPKGESPLRKHLEDSTKKLGLVKMFYAGIIKRRLRHVMLPSSPAARLDGATLEASTMQSCPAATGNYVSRVDELMALLKRIPDETDELASAYYELDEEEARINLQTVQECAERAAGLAWTNWSGANDGFTDWLDRWLHMIRNVEPK